VSTPTPAVVERYFAAVNAEDWAAVGNLFTSDGELAAVGAPPRRGREAIAAHFPWTLAALPVHHDEPTRIVVAGAVVLVEIRFSGRNRAGAEVAFDAVDVFDLTADGTAIARLTSWYDTAAVGRMVRAS
jgi:ketosteroid isomerase-like protein